ncbi:hypothetical protein CGZ80_14685 [Rhodopirellula sp. MGV]|nr:hypothetical protein CGZ80_14685 [Rhodopirellula sp. MGV]
MTAFVGRLFDLFLISVTQFESFRNAFDLQRLDASDLDFDLLQAFHLGWVENFFQLLGCLGVERFHLAAELFETLCHGFAIKTATVPVWAFHFWAAFVDFFNRCCLIWKQVDFFFDFIDSQQSQDAATTHSATETAGSARATAWESAAPTTLCRCVGCDHRKDGRAQQCHRKLLHLHWFKFPGVGTEKREELF